MMVEMVPVRRLGTRASARIPVELDAQFQTPAGTVRSTVMNLCRVGACMPLPFYIATGDEGLLIVEGVVVPSRVVWKRAGLCGLSFYRPLPPECFQAIRDAAALEPAHKPPRHIWGTSGTRWP